MVIVCVQIVRHNASFSAADIYLRAAYMARKCGNTSQSMMYLGQAVNQPIIDVTQSINQRRTMCARIFAGALQRSTTTRTDVHGGLDAAFMSRTLDIVRQAAKLLKQSVCCGQTDVTVNGCVRMTMPAPYVWQPTPSMRRCKACITRVW
jgi:hypothetical protein